MRFKLAGLLLVLAVMLSTVRVASADVNQVIFGGSPGGSFSFTGAPTGWTLSLSGVSGVAFGSGIFASSGTYNITQGMGVTLTGTPGLGDNWNISQSAPLTFKYVNGGTTLLQGDLQLVNLSQDIAGGSTGTFNYGLSANLTNLNGTLVGPNLFSGSAVVSFTIDFASGTSLSTLTGTSNTLTAAVSAGEINPTPEPASMALAGAGLLALGGFIRRRKK
jgi:PEP-CTERM motif